jgi:pilus assembly protein Flp/PilA
MTRLKGRISGLRDRGASAVEYGLMVAAIAAVVVLLVFGLGGVVQQIFANTCDTIKNSAQARTGC